jgi:hypothetical protein
VEYSWGVPLRDEGAKGTHMSTVLQRPWLLALLLGLVAAAAAGLVSAHNGDATQIHACVNQGATPRGQVIVYAAPGLTGGEPATSTCGTRGTPVDWNAQGVQGPAGPTGATGPRGTGNAVEATSVPSVNLTLTSTVVGQAATITPGPGGRVLVTGWLVASNPNSPPCQVLAELLVDGVTTAGGTAIAVVPQGVPIIGGAANMTIPLTTALVLSPNTSHTVQIRALGFEQENAAAACGIARRTNLVLVDLG